MRLPTNGTTRPLLLVLALTLLPVVPTPALGQSLLPQEAFFKASSIDISDGFGGAIALSGDTLVVGALV